MATQALLSRGKERAKEREMRGEEKEEGDDKLLVIYVASGKYHPFFFLFLALYVTLPDVSHQQNRWNRLTSLLSPSSSLPSLPLGLKVTTRGRATSSSTLCTVSARRREADSPPSFKDQREEPSVFTMTKEVIENTYFPSNTWKDHERQLQGTNVTCKGKRRGRGRGKKGAKIKAIPRAIFHNFFLTWW